MNKILFFFLVLLGKNSSADPLNGNALQGFENFIIIYSVGILAFLTWIIGFLIVLIGKSRNEKLPPYFRIVAYSTGLILALAFLKFNSWG